MPHDRPHLPERIPTRARSGSPTAAAALRALHRSADPQRARFARSYFKTGPGQYGHGDRFLGLRVPQVRALARTYRELPLPEVRRLLASEWHEARLLALLILVVLYQRGDAAQRECIFRFYLRNTARINNWDLVDSSASYICGPHLTTTERAMLRALARSSNVWERRIAVLATFHAVGHGDFGPGLRVARMLLDDPHDLIHKAVGWMLREIGKRDQDVEERFLRAHSHRMPRTMLRYAIERFPEPLRRRYLQT